MIQNNRVIKTTIFVVFLFVILFLPIFNKTGVIFVQADREGHLNNGDLKNLLDQASSKINDSCFTSIKNIIENGFTQEQYNYILKLKGQEYIDKYAISTSSYLTSLDFNCDKITKIHDYILSYNLSDNENTNLYGTPNFLNCVDTTFNEVAAINRDILDKLKEYACGKINYDGLKEYFTKQLEIDLNQYSQNIDQINFLASSGITPPPVTSTPECAIGYSGGSFWDLITQPLNLLVGAIITLFTNILKFVLQKIIEAFWWVLTVLPSVIGGYTTSSPVKSLWTQFLKYANLSIILGVIFTGIATILRLEKYSWQKLLPKLIIAALLVNFSLVICGIFVDLSNYLSFIFLSASSGNNLGNLIVGVINNIICAFRASDQSFDYIMGATVGLIITSIMIFQFAGLLFYVLSRLFTIIICAATSPLVFIGMALNLDPLKNLVNEWRNKFTQALVNLVILSMMLYISLTIVNGMASNIRQETNFVPLIGYAGFIIVIFQTVKIVANAIGVQQIEKAYGFAKTAISGLAVAGISALGGAALTEIAGSETFKTIGTNLTKSRIPLLSSPINEVGYRMLNQHNTAQISSEIKKAQDEVKNLDKDTITETLSQPPPPRADRKNYARYMAALSIALQNGWVKVGDKVFENLQKLIDSKNPDLNKKEIIAAFPHVFKEEGGLLVKIDPQNVKDIARNLQALGPDKMPKNVDEILNYITKFGGDIKEFIIELMKSSRSNIPRSFFDRIPEKEWEIGTIFGGTIENPKPLGGSNGAIHQMLKDNLEKARKSGNPEEIKQAEALLQKFEDWLKRYPDTFG